MLKHVEQGLWARNPPPGIPDLTPGAWMLLYQLQQCGSVPYHSLLSPSDAVELLRKSLCKVIRGENCDVWALNILGLDLAVRMTGDEWIGRGALLH